MNDIRRSILWVIFAFSLILLWDRWQLHNGRSAFFFPQPAATTASAPVAASDAVPGITPGAQTPQASTALIQTGQPPIEAPSAAPAAAAERIEVSTDVLRLSFSTEGGSLNRVELLDYENDARDGQVVLLDESNTRAYVAQTGLIGGDFPNHKTIMRLADGPRSLADGQDSLQLRFESPVQGGVQLVKTWTLQRGQYAIAVRHEVLNHGQAAVAPQLYEQLVRDGGTIDGGVMFTGTYTGPAIYTDEEKFQKVEFKDIDKGNTKFQKTSASGYAAMVQHYFAAAWIPPAGLQREYFVRKPGNGLYAVGAIAPFSSIAPGASQTLDSTFYAGPQIERELQEISPGLELVKDYGMVKALAKPLYWLLDRLHDLLGNWGWAIVALVFLLKIAFYWLNARAYASMAKMKAINPRIMQMRERYKDNPQQMQQEMIRIYREEKVNPLGGCLPILIQMPFFIALYWVLLSSVEMRHAPWIGWIHDLSAPDPYFILPLLMMLSSLLQVALNPQPPDPMQAKMMWIMPLVFSVMFFFFPAGLVLYWLTNNILSIAQQWIINTRMGVPPQFNLPKFK
ncbi:membrane protein insertase YidC [Vandammella animalimorsus]|uniref:Membrane protein insertase YidC n=1 Tax=Vandammella animalimorsus TaxID=2029117 RepID=A0A2A2T788_9BURK|nr:membrane protein insertase YidC [Vandammella animalimorsus]PAT33081.1 membrane protein insertase YidC [Vandammella animalimorsus]PAX17495.1 membrane protein insertase YidC [Vandammella animalimorsus]PAX19548.1 membrane protein insertase YidC [Vandammella animalimorsus]